MMIALISIFYAAAAYLEISSLKITGSGKQILLYSFMLTAAYVLSLLIALDVNIPSLKRPIGDIVFSIMGEK